MAVVKTGDLPGFIEEQRPEIAPPLDAIGEAVQKALGAIGKPLGEPGQQLKDFLNGTWLGHSVHAALSDAPIGAWAMSFLLDLTGHRRAADFCVGVGILAAVPTAAAGVADWRDSNAGPMRTGILHALTNTAALGCYIGSWLARRSGNRGLGVGLSGAGLALVTTGAYLGGDMVYRQGMAVNRNAWDPSEVDWQPALSINQAHEGKLLRGEIEVEGTKLPVVLFRRGDTVTAISGTCSHLGGPLQEGKLVNGDEVQCPWHRSRFSVIDGSVTCGPAAHPQPTYEARIRDGFVEVRRAAPD